MLPEDKFEDILQLLESAFVDNPEKVSPFIGDQIITSCRHYSLLRGSGISMERWIKRVNFCLRTQAHCQLGLKLLRETLRRCGTEIFQQNSVLWFRQLTSVALSEFPVEDRVAALECLAEVIQFSAPFPELVKELSSKELVPQTLTSLFLVDKDLWKGALAFLNQCLRCFSGAAGSVGKGKCERFALNVLDDPLLDKTLRVSAAKFFALLPKIGGPGAGGARHREAWESQFGLLCATLDEIVDDIFRDVLPPPTEVDASKSRSSLPLRSLFLSSEDEARYFSLLRRFDVFSSCVSAMLENDLGVTVSVPFKRIISTLIRVCNVTPARLVVRPKNQSLMVAAVLPEMFCVATRTLNQLVSIGGRRLFEHGVAINRLILQLLVACSPAREDGESKTLSQESTFQKVRVSIYELCRTWFSVFPSVEAGIKGDAASKFLEHFIRDSRPEELDKEKLTCINTLAPKRRKKLDSGSVSNVNVYRSVFFERKMDYQAKEDICCAALGAVATLLLSQGRNLSLEFHKTLVEFSVPLMKSVCAKQSTKMLIPKPYTTHICRIAMYDVMKAFVLCPSPRWPPPLAAVANLFRDGQDDPISCVRKVCSEGAVMMSHLLHPRVYPFQVPMPAPKDLKKSREEDMDEIKNRVIINGFLVNNPHNIAVNSDLNADSSPKLTLEEVSIPDKVDPTNHETDVDKQTPIVGDGEPKSNDPGEEIPEEIPAEETSETHPETQADLAVKSPSKSMDLSPPEVQWTDTTGEFQGLGEKFRSSKPEEQTKSMDVAGPSCLEGIVNSEVEHKTPTQDDTDLEAMLKDFNPDAAPDVD